MSYSSSGLGESGLVRASSFDRLYLGVASYSRIKSSVRLCQWSREVWMPYAALKERVAAERTSIRLAT